VHSLSGHNQRLTHVHDETKSFVNDPLSAGMPSYVMQEEFNRYQGFWWQPDCEPDGIYRICFEEVDESEVTMLPHKFSGDAEEYRFPRAGTPNAKSNLKMIEFRLSEALRITDISIKELQYPLAYTFPWLEYLVRVGWTPDSSCIWAQLLNRQQQRLNLILIPIENFSCEPYNSNSSSPEQEEKHLWKSIVDRSPKPIQVIYTEYAAQSWINIHDILLFLDISDKSVQFIWASEETGFRHLYLVTSSLVVKPQNGVKITHSAFFDHNYEEDHLKPRIMKKVGSNPSNY
jgi:dipeptidyl-peptidase 9